MDAFSVAIATGLALRQVFPRQYFRLSFHFGLFQGLMPIIGWVAGTTVAAYISAVDHWIAFALLAYVGGKMIRGSFSEHDEGDLPKRLVKDPTRGSSLVMLSVATSIDALAVGLSLAFLRVSIFIPALVIGLVAASLTFLGLRLGRYAGSKLGPWMERVGGLILLGIGIKIVVEHLGLLAL
jgi:putative Mn2+ efflux pump MntP